MADTDPDRDHSSEPSDEHQRRTAEFLNVLRKALEELRARTEPETE